MSVALLLVVGLAAGVAETEPPGTATESVAVSATRAPYLFDIDLTLRGTARAGEPQTALQVEAASAGGTTLPDWRVDRLLRPQAAKSYPSAVLAASGEVEPIRGLSLRALFDSGELRSGSSLDPAVADAVTIDGGEVGTWFASGAFVRELAVTVSRPSWSAEVGRRFTKVGEGLVYEDFGTGAALALDFGGHDALVSRLEAQAFAVGHTFDDLKTPSPFVMLKLTHERSPFESIDVFGALFLERSGILRDVLTSVVSERVIANNDGLMEQARLTRLFLVDRPSLGRLSYLGVSGNLLPADGLSLRGALVGNLGRVIVAGPDGNYTFRLSGAAATFDASYGLTEALGVGVTLVALSGDDPPALLPDQTVPYHTFAAVAPYWAWTGLFFSGGLNQGMYPGRAAAAGVNGRGVLASIARGDWTSDLLRASACAALLFSAAGPPPAGIGGGSSFYGVETDLVVELQPFELVGIGLEGDLFWPGSFFPQHDLAYRALGQIHVHLGN
ncbi:MAG: hypothetical protein HY903_22935 [Deltaproteobacteria bacterium]|nr:hypothetical protein [Deltaproteobacteria bacterium]